jgi:hypothetical protein
MLPKLTVALAFVLVMLFAPLAPYLSGSRLEVRRRRAPRRNCVPCPSSCSQDGSGVLHVPPCGQVRPTDDVAGPARPLYE